MGQPGSGKTTLIRDSLERRAATQPVPTDLCYVNNFADPRCPTALQLPGRAVHLRHDLDALVDELATAIPKAFDSEDYTRQRDQTLEDLEAKRGEALGRLNQHVTGAGFRLLIGPGGLLLVPAIGGKPLKEDLPAVLAYLEALRADVTAHLDDFRKGKEGEAAAGPMPRCLAPTARCRAIK